MLSLCGSMIQDIRDIMLNESNKGIGSLLLFWRLGIVEEDCLWVFSIEFKRWKGWYSKATWSEERWLIESYFFAVDNRTKARTYRELKLNCFYLGFLLWSRTEFVGMGSKHIGRTITSQWVDALLDNFYQSKLVQYKTASILRTSYGKAKGSVQSLHEEKGIKV